MNTKLFLIGLAAVTGTALLLLHPAEDSEVADSVFLSRFAGFQRTHRKRYSSPREMEYRLEVFKANCRFIDAHNADALATYTLGITPFADLTFEEFAGMMGSPPEDPEVFAAVTEPAPEAQPGLDDPEEVNWLDAGRVSAVKNQGSCLGAGKSFAFVASAESSLLFEDQFRKPNLSEQELVDCASFNDCQRTGHSSLIDYISQKGLSQTSDYPYRGRDSACKSGSPSTRRIQVKKIVSVRKGTPNLISFLQTQPATVTFGLQKDLQHYVDGIYHPAECKERVLDHTVLAIGFNLKAPVPYFIFKNSWGFDWGIRGYFKVAVGPSPQGICGIGEGEYNIAIIVN